MHSSGFERFYPHWTFGVCYCKSSTDYVSKLLGFNEFFASIDLKRDDLFDNNLDEIFSILGEYSQIKTGPFILKTCISGIVILKFIVIKIENLFIEMFHNLRVFMETKNLKLKTVFRYLSDLLSSMLVLHKKRAFLSWKTTVFSIILLEERITILTSNMLLRSLETKKKLVLFGAGKDGLRALIALRALFDIEPYSFVITLQSCRHRDSRRKSNQL